MQLKENPWLSPGIIIKGPYGAVLQIRSTWEGKTTMSTETLVVDVLVGSKFFSKIPVENLEKIR